MYAFWECILMASNLVFYSHTLEKQRSRIVLGRYRVQNIHLFPTGFHLTQESIFIYEIMLTM